MPTLSRDLRRQLENTVREARRTAEAGARKVIEQLGVGASKAPPLTQAQTKLRNALRAHGRQLGDRRDGQSGVQAVDRLVVEIAYEHWHRLLFTRYLAELELLALPGELPMPIEDWKQHALETETDWIELASRSAQTMLPQIFRSGDPVLEVALPPETRSALEELMKALPRDVFVADDSLGWVYQYWQADRKEEVNRSEKKIGADELPAVTQLFTEDYMVLFLLHNTLGAWWAGRVLAANLHLAESASNEDDLRAACAVGDVEWTYLRFVRDPTLPSPAGRGAGGEGAGGEGAGGEGAGGVGAIARRHHDIPKSTLDFARTLRKTQTDAENLIWMLLRDRRLGGFKFRRQHPVPPYIVDFYCHEARLAVELDGGQHADASPRDAVRDACLGQQRIRVLRFWNNEVFQETDAVLEAIWNALHEETPSPPAPLPEGEGSEASSPPTPTQEPVAEGHPLFPSPSGRRWREAPDEGARSLASKAPVAGQGTERSLPEGEGRWRPAAGTFDGWPKATKDITLLDPCMGSGHFLVFALPMLAAMRAAEEGLTAEAAIEAVLRDNLFGLEIDPRCTQIAAFNLALAAWRRIGYRQLPSLHLACSGLSLSVSKAEWLKLAERASSPLLPGEGPGVRAHHSPLPPGERPGARADHSPLPPGERPGARADHSPLPPGEGPGVRAYPFPDAMQRGFERLYDLFARAPWLGSLIDPRASGGDLIEHGFDDLEPLLAQVMAKAETAELAEMAVAAQGLAKASEILAGRYTLVATNVPYLGRGKQDEVLKAWCERQHPDAKADLATCFVERCLGFCTEGGSTALVTPQNWLFLGAYKKLRERLLKEAEWNAVARLGEHGFDSQQAAGAFTALLALSRRRAGAGHRFAGWDASTGATPGEKDSALLGEGVRVITQVEQLRNPDYVVTLENAVSRRLLDSVARAWQGLVTGDDNRYHFNFWQVADLFDTWRPIQQAPPVTMAYAGRSDVLRWENERGALHASQTAHNFPPRKVFGKWGIAVQRMRRLNVTLFSGEVFDDSVAPLVPEDSSLVLPLWCYCQSDEYANEVRRLNQHVKVVPGTLTKVPFDLAHWQQAAAERYPNGLPKPYSDDPTQWLFDGHPKSALTPGPSPKGRGEGLQVAVARLVGYRWPRQTGSSFPDCPALGPDGLEKHADRDGIVALNPVKGEQAAAARLLAMLADAFGAEWSAAKLDGLLAQVGYPGKTLDDWLRDGFFEQHCELFHQRPFVWHIWDGRRDGFHVLVNYHRLAAPSGEGRRTLEKLLYSYLGDWIDRQRADQQAGIEGADARVAAAEHLKAELTNILTGEPPYDLFVRWKPLAEQPIGWEPDINDGVRVNIRPFMNARLAPSPAPSPRPSPGGRGSKRCILRVTPKIKWDKDRGKEPQRVREDFPWFWGWDSDNKDDQKDFGGRGKEPDGNRWNDLHYTRAFKQAARDRSKRP